MTKKQVDKLMAEALKYDVLRAQNVDKIQMVAAGLARVITETFEREAVDDAQAMTIMSCLVAGAMFITGATDEKAFRLTENTTRAFLKAMQDHAKEFGDG